MRLRAVNIRLEADLDTARRVIEVQGKVSALLEDLSRRARARRVRGANAVAVRAEFTTAVEQVTDQAVLDLTPLIGATGVCIAAGRTRATHYRRHRISPEWADILAVLHSDRFADAAPAQVWATLLDEGTYLGSQSTFYRLLHTVHGDVKECRSQATHPAKWSYFYLYAVLDVFSRKLVGWMVATRESATLAEQLIAATIAAEKVPARQLTLHADRASSMASKPVAPLLADLGVTKAHSRPRVSNDCEYECVAD